MSGGGSELRLRARAALRAARARLPRQADGLAVLRATLRRPVRQAEITVDMTRRMHVLERDLALLAAHVGVLSEQRDADVTGQVDVRADLAAARLGAIALYEHRIGELESWMRSTRPGGRARGATSREFGVNE